MIVLENGQYIAVLAELKAKISQAKIQAIQAVNERLLQLYWEISHTILVQQESAGWGSKIIKTLASDLKMAFPDSKGFSERNLVYMQTFAATYPKRWDLASEEVGKTSVSQGFTITQPLVAQMTCGNGAQWFVTHRISKTTTVFWCNRSVLNALHQGKGVGNE